MIDNNNMTSLKSSNSYDLQNFENQNYGTINNNATDEPPKSKSEYTIL